LKYAQGPSFGGNAAGCFRSLWFIRDPPHRFTGSNRRRANGNKEHLSPAISLAENDAGDKVQEAARADVSHPPSPLPGAVQ
jgi:hypothetical protein